MGKLKLLLFLLVFPISVHAACSSSSISRYKSLAGNINYYYDYVNDNFNVIFYNVSNELKIVDKGNGHEYFADSNLGNVYVNNLLPGSIVNFAVYPISSDCSDYRVFTFYINLPSFNKYYGDPVCVNNSNILCSKWSNTSMYSYEQFVNIVKMDNDKEIVEQKPEKEIHKYGFFDFLGDYYIYILLFIIISGSVGIYFLDKKSKFDFKVS